MDDDIEAPRRLEDRFTPDTLPGAGPAYGASEPYDPASPVSQTAQEPLQGDVSAEAAVIAAIQEQLKAYAVPDPGRIEVAYDHGVAILSGTVRDDAARRLAQEAALATHGVTAVDNDLKVA